MIWWIAAIVCCVDQLAKFWAVHALGSGRTITLIENFLRLAYAENQGGAAGLMQSHPQVLTLLSVLALCVFVWWSRTVPREQRLARLGFAAVMGGAVGNLLDRFFRGGFLVGTYVVDFIDAHWYDRVHWPTFNVADSSICIGIGIILVAQYRYYRQHKRQLAADGTQEPAA